MSRASTTLEIAEGVTLDITLEGVEGVPARTLHLLMGMLQESTGTLAHHAEAELRALALERQAAERQAEAFQGPGRFPGEWPAPPEENYVVEVRAECDGGDLATNGNSPEAAAELAQQHADAMGPGHAVVVYALRRDGRVDARKVFYPATSAAEAARPEYLAGDGSQDRPTGVPDEDRARE